MDANDFKEGQLLAALLFAAAGAGRRVNLVRVSLTQEELARHFGDAVSIGRSIEKKAKKKKKARKQ